MPYLGAQPLTSAQRDVVVHPSSATATFYAVYTPGFIDVYQNGVLLHPDDYVATTGTTVVLDTAADASDVIITIAWTTFEPTNSSRVVVDNFTDTTDYTSGTTTQLTLSQQPSSENYIEVYFDGVTQHHDTYSLSGTTLTFSSAIPTGTDNVEVVIIYVPSFSDTPALGGGNDRIFFENGQNVTTDYTITTNRNAMSAGDITIDSGVTVTIPSGSKWIIV